MAYGFDPALMFAAPNPVQNFLTPEEQQQLAIQERFNAGRKQGFVPAMMGALDYMRTAMPAQAPTPRTVSGGSVIGLMPEQTNALLNRVNEANMLDQRMFEARQGETRADLRAREGRILSAREAQARRQQELAIEKQKADMQMKKEAEERARPKLTPIAGTNLAYEERVGPDGNPTINVVPVGGEQIPVKPAAAKMGWIPSADGTTATWGELQPGITTKSLVKPEKPLSSKDQLDMMESLSKTDLDDVTRQTVFNDWVETGRLPFMNFIDKEDTKKTRVTVENPDGSTILKVVNTDDIPEQGIQTKPAKKTDPKSAINIIQDAFEVKKLSEAPRRQAMDLLDRLGFDASWINKLADEQGMVDDVEYGWDDSKSPSQYRLPESEAPATPAGKTVVERRKNPTTGKIMVKYNDGSTGYE